MHLDAWRVSATVAVNPHGHLLGLKSNLQLFAAMMQGSSQKSFLMFFLTYVRCISHPYRQRDARHAIGWVRNGNIDVTTAATVTVATLATAWLVHAAKSEVINPCKINYSKDDNRVSCQTARSLANRHQEDS